VRAIEHGLRFGAHGLPLMGCGDWNDGMNRVGEPGAGESVWLAFFLYDVLTQFAELAARAAIPRLPTAASLRGGAAAAEHRAACLGRRMVPARLLRRRQPLGSATNPECQIDSLPRAGR
jgi:cyclic beta-1,2-glucan synthetase